MHVQWPAVTIVGVGLIGGSVGMALRSRGLAERVIGVGRSAAGMAEARRAGAVDETTDDLAAGVAAADLVVVATGVGAIPGLLDAIDAAVRPGTLLTDAGSTKASIVGAWERRRASRRGRFVGAHPIAGSHRRGASAGAADLFVGRVTVVTPAPRTPPRDAEEVGGFWSALGATVFMMPPRAHDRLLASSSHAPHVVAAAVAAATPPEVRALVAGGWRDTTRIAAGDPELWVDILLDNARFVIAALRRVERAGARMRAAIEGGDRSRLLALLRDAKMRRDAADAPPDDSGTVRRRERGARGVDRDHDATS
jgi:prephenate dehydrogenase